MRYFRGIGALCTKPWELHHTQQCLKRENRRKLQDSIETANNGIWLWHHDMGYLYLVGSFKKEPYKRDYVLQKRHIISRSLLIVGTPCLSLDAAPTAWYRGRRFLGMRYFRGIGALFCMRYFRGGRRGERADSSEVPHTNLPLWVIQSFLVQEQNDKLALPKLTKRHVQGIQTWPPLFL